MAELGGVLIFLFWVFVIVVAILAFLLPIIVYNMRQTQKEMQDSLEAIGRILGEMADKTDRQTEIMETEHKLKMVGRKAREAKPA